MSCSTTSQPGVLRPRQLGEEAVEVDVTGSELAEHTSAPGFGHVGAVGDHAREDVVPHVFDVHVVDALTPVAKRLARIAATESEVARVEQQADVRQLEHALDLPRRFDERRGVVVERRLEAAVARQVGGPRDTFGQPAPARGVEPDRLIRSGAARELRALRRTHRRRGRPSPRSLRRRQRAPAFSPMAARSSAQCWGSLKRMGMYPPTSARPYSSRRSRRLSRWPR